MKIALFAALSTVMLSACVSQKTTLTNTAGQQTHCDSWGFGVIGVPIAMASHHSCMEKAKSAGYSEFPSAGEN